MKNMMLHFIRLNKGLKITSVKIFTIHFPGFKENIYFSTQDSVTLYTRAHNLV